MRGMPTPLSCTELIDRAAICEECLGREWMTLTRGKVVHIYHAQPLIVSANSNSQ